VLLFRMGDFYETFDDDAKVAAEVLGIALTSRPMGGADGRVPLAGVPHHQLERYLDQLVAAGHRVAICEQTSLPPSQGGPKGLVERRVTRVVTPGTVDTGTLLEGGGHNWLVALSPPLGVGSDARRGLAACDITTGELELQLTDLEGLAGELARLAPRELLLAEDDAVDLPRGLDPAPLETRRPEREFRPAAAEEALRDALGVASLEAYGVTGQEAALGAAGAIVSALERQWPAALPHLRPPRVVRPGEVMPLDPQTRRSLELFAGMRGAGSLAESINRTLTPLGARLLRARLGQPLRQAAPIRARLAEVAAFHAAPAARERLRAELRGLPDLERLLGRVRSGRAPARQLAQLARGLTRLPALQAAARESDAEAIDLIAGDLGGLEETAQAVAAAIVEDPPAEVGEPPTIAEGADGEVDRLRSLAGGAREALSALESRERERTGVASLKVGYHRVFGYYLECPRSQAERMPEDYEPRQTLANSQRFRFAPLSELEAEILGAAERLASAEHDVLARLADQLRTAGRAIERAAGGVARLDVASALAALAAERQFVEPEIEERPGLAIEGGRHPVVETRLERGAFVPNDTHLGGPDGPDLVVLTGPNMAGKSTYLRQTALIVLLAQCGSFVPARAARIGVCDGIFSRVGAQDDIAAGQSTFMVEMLETATILHHATERSLVILDEVGRGTSTYDGLAIAQAVVEHLHHRPGGTPLTLFATHYQELTQLARTLPRIANRSVAVREEAVANRRGAGRELVFLHEIIDGASDRSYGVHVAALAGLPRAVVARARELLARLEAAPGTGAPGPGDQLPLLGAQVEPGAPADGLWSELAELDPDELSPLDALQRLYELRRRARERLALED
jgi:DNA mismatch repair protein MutS